MNKTNLGNTQQKCSSCFHRGECIFFKLNMADGTRKCPRQGYDYCTLDTKGTFEYIPKPRGKWEEELKYFIATHSN